MAVTAQLARVLPELLTACAASVDTLDAVCSFRAVPEQDHLDLDWAPPLLERACRVAGVEPRLLDGLRRATEGYREVNPAYRDRPGTVWEHPVTALCPAAVADVAARLAALDVDAVLAALPADPTEAADVLRTELDDPRPYLAEHADALRRFYAEAARRGLATVLWWD